MLNLSKQMKAVMTIIRNRETCREDFIFHADRMVRFLVEEGLAHLPCTMHVADSSVLRQPNVLVVLCRSCDLTSLRAGPACQLSAGRR